MYVRTHSYWIRRVRSCTANACSLRNQCMLLTSRSGLDAGTLALGLEKNEKLGLRNRSSVPARLWVKRK